MDQEIRVERTIGEGSWGEDGKYSGGDIMEFTEKASVQPLSGKQAQLLPEGRRAEDSIIIFIKADLFTAKTSENKKADIVIYQNRRFEVWNVKVWLEPTLSHFEVIALEELN